MAIKTGTYQHYKGKYYQVIGVAKHSETEEELIAYYCLYPNEKGQLWVRPMSMFFGEVESNGKKTARFLFIKED